ncbi:uncharacterized protein LY89DRAFT_746723 [Mollisia scopiformis]|uniref:Methyltransferase domain-containing protein n=1 Tax=Mollisia scopiformis TaxID=149040 RepID=A0A194XE35_MOLSC|nr:uncharacterized protein LY89DRAFT_746723 [Mollisia scopiformis]KUJ18433.1 hypothetical protein LY89DRAFT_746723 [Mollisia scopiformis]
MTMAQSSTQTVSIENDKSSKDVPWYSKDMTSQLGAPARDLLERYSKIPADEVETHIYSVRDEAWQVFPYPCIGQFRFLDLGISLNPNYETVLERLKTGKENFLDLGCCFGQDLRKLAADGAPSENLYGVDLRPEFFDMGYKLFRDRELLNANFIVADLFDSNSDLHSLNGKVDIISAGSFLHLFNYEGQIDACKVIVRLLRETAEGSVLIGRQVGSSEAGEVVHHSNPGQSLFRHNSNSFKKMWEEVGGQTPSGLSKWKNMWKHQMSEKRIIGVILSCVSLHLRCSEMLESRMACVVYA